MPEDVNEFMELAAYQGAGNERTRRLLHLESIYRGGRYETVIIKGVPQDAREWDDDLDAKGDLIPAAERKPMLELGVAEAMVDRLADLCVGRGRTPTLQLEGSGADEVSEALTGEGGLDLWFHADQQAVDVIVIGSTCFGFHRPTPEGVAPQYDYIQLPPAWCERVTYGQRETDRAKQLAKEMAEAGATVDGGPLLLAPADARSETLIFVRHQWQSRDEVATRPGGSRTETRITWRRRDYTADAIVEYKPVTVAETDKRAPRLEPLPVEPHGWGIVPLVWVRARGARGDEPEGRSYVEGPVDKVTAVADRSASFWSKACHVSGSPTLLIIDLEDALETQRTLADQDIQSEFIAAGPKAVLKLNTAGAAAMTGKAGSAQLLEPSGGGLAALEKNTYGLVQLAYEAGRLTRPTAELLKGAMSGVALERLHATDIGLASGIQTRLAKGWKALAPKLAAAMEADGVAGVKSDGLTASLQWPRIFPYTAQDVKEWTEALSLGVVTGFVSLEQAALKLATILETPDPELEAKKLLEREAEVLESLRRRQPAAAAGGGE